MSIDGTIDEDELLDSDFDFLRGISMTSNDNIRKNKYHESGKVLRKVLDVGFGTGRDRFTLLFETLDEVLGELKSFCGRVDGRNQFLMV